MEFRQLGQSDVHVSEIGFGAWAIGGDAWGPVADAESLAALRHAVECDITLIDTADVYGEGHSEELVAQVLQGRRERVVVSTKGGLMGHHRDPARGPVYDRPAKVVEAFEASLRRLGTDYVDVYFDHIWWDDERETEAFLAAFAQLKRDGKARAVGVSTDNMAYVEHFNRDGALDVVQLEYSILNRQVERSLLPYCQEHGIGVVVRGPLGKGLLTGKFSEATRFPEGDVRAGWPDEPWFRDALRQVDALRTLERPDRTLGQLALAFVLDQPAVAAAIPGAKTPAQVEANATASRRPLLTDEERRLIDEVSPP